MSYSPDQLIKITSNYADLAASKLIAEAKKKEKKKLDPKAKVRNRGTVCVPAESAKDKKDHFPINDEGQARNALARVQQLSSAPWYKGSLEGLKALVARKVKAKYPGIDVGGKKEKKSSLEVLFAKYAQAYGEMTEYELAEAAKTGTNIQGVGELKGEPWLKNLMNNGQISQRLYQSAANVLNISQTPNAMTPQSYQQHQQHQQQQQHGMPFDPKIKQVQQALNKMRLTGADGKPLAEDGQRGKNTNFAIQSFKTEYQMPNATDAIVFNSILHPDSRANKGYAGGGAPAQQAAPTGDAIDNYWANNPNK